jgi:hypothetical protein
VRFRSAGSGRSGREFGGQECEELERVLVGAAGCGLVDRYSQMLVLGPDALTWFRDAMKELNADVDAWEQTSLSTSFPG